MTASQIASTTPSPSSQPSFDPARFSPESLIDAIIRLTHSIDTEKARGSDSQRLADYRARRAVARAELLRRLADR